MRPSFIGLTAATACLALAALAGQTAAQNAAPTAPEPAHGASEPAPAPPAAAAAAAPLTPGGFPARPPAYPFMRMTDPVAGQRGKVLYNETFGCAACHAPDIRGTDRGNSLLRSQAVMQDANGELLATATVASRAHAGRFNTVTEAQFSDIAQHLKSFTNIGTGTTAPILTPVVFQAGDAAAGQRYFASNCASCHAVAPGQASPAANLAGIGRGVEPRGLPARDLQQRWLSPTTEKPTTAIVTMADGTRLQGRATRLTEFALNLTLTDGTTRVIQRDGDNPKIEMTYPLAAHAALLRKITDKQINDVTGYLVTLK